MNYTCRLIVALSFWAFCGSGTALYANNPVYTQRVTNYIDSNIAHLGSNGIILQAYMGQPIDTTYLEGLLANANENGTFDFSLDQIVRICYLSNGAYDSMILPVVNTVPYWLTANDTQRDYWSENHMIQWMSADWLLHERYGKPVDSNLHYRVRHFLQVKVQYGFYEFFSSVYGPYCLSPLLNLADFAQDTTIKNLAAQASQKLLANFLILTNNQGVFYPAAGRNYSGKYETPFGQNHNDLIYLLTGLGQPNGGGSPGGVMLATSSVPVDTVISSFVSHLDTTMYIGHGLDSGFVINDSLIATDKTLFQWSSGAYFHPEVAEQTAVLVSDSNLWVNSAFSSFSFLSGISLSQVEPFAEQVSAISESSVICGDTVVIFKNNAISLSSVQNFWKGKLGYETFPVVANVGNTAVYTASGKVDSSWTARSATNFNNDLPYVSQHKNVALIMYRPETALVSLGYTHPEVSMHFTDSVYDEIRYDGMWVLGRQGSSYVGVRRECIDSANGIRACYTKDGQTWIIMVGDSTMYDSFDSFQTVIDSSRFQEQWYYDSTTAEWVYYASISIDTINIAYAWSGDSTSANPTTGIAQVANMSVLKAYPNPAKDNITLDLSSFAGENLSISVVNVLGERIYSEGMNGNASNNKSINTSNWPDGLYTIVVEDQQGTYTQRVVEQH